MTTHTQTSPSDLHDNFVQRVRPDFPILHTSHHGHSLAYLDNAATTQKPRQVIEAIVRYYESQNANIHRGVYHLSQTATNLYEQTREKVRHFLNAADSAEIIFTRGTTESINLVAASWGRKNLTPGDEVIVTQLEHHSDIVPWQMICETTGAILKVIPINDAGELDLAEYDKLLASGKVKMVAFNHVSNSLGTINPVAEIVRRAHAKNALTLVDGAQWVAHGTTDVQDLNADFYAFSGHKLFAPTGIGILYGKRSLLEAMPPYQGGGDMIESVSFEKTTFAQLPNKFEAGTPDIAGVVGLGAAIDYLHTHTLTRIGIYEHILLTYATQRLLEVPRLRIIGTARHKAAVISFVIDGISSLDIGMKLDKENIALRTGHHCCQPVMERFHISSTARASFAFYNTKEEIDRLVDALKRIVDETPAAPAPAPSQMIEYPQAFAKSPQATADKLAEDFAFIGEAGGRDAKNEYLLDLATKLPNLFPLLSKVTMRVPGCMSQVYLVARKKPGTGDTFEFVADADAEIVRGLIALLQKLYSGQPAQAVLRFDIESFFHRIGLEQFITQQRRNGLSGMIEKIKESARAIQGDNS